MPLVPAKRPEPGGHRSLFQTIKIRHRNRKYELSRRRLSPTGAAQRRSPGLLGYTAVLHSIASHEAARGRHGRITLPVPPGALFSDDKVGLSFQPGKPLPSPRRWVELSPRPTSRSGPDNILTQSPIGSGGYPAASPPVRSCSRWIEGRSACRSHRTAPP